MTNYNRRVFEMLVRVLVFRSAHKDLIGKDSQVGQLFQKVEAALDKISAQAALQTSGKNDVRVSSKQRNVARDNLRRMLEGICRTGVSIGLNQFFMPRDKNDRSLANVGRVFLSMVEPFAAEFIANHLPEDFIDRLKAAIENIERSIQQQAASKGARKTATTAISGAQAEALGALARVDAIIENLLSDNEPVMAAWYSARRIERAPSAKKPSETEESANTPPATAAAATAA